MRALAILAVIAFHTGARAFGSGFYGVDVFFVLSGFLITTLLLQERAATGTISLRLFWGRRTARLLPALLVVCGLVAIVSAVNAVVAVRPVLNPTSTGTAFAGIGLALTQLASWAQALTGADLGALTHSWALSVEEWFYLVWPLLLLLILRRPRWTTRLVLAAALVGVVDRLVSERAISSASYLYFAPDERAYQLLIGCGLAAIMVTYGARIRRHSRALMLLGLAGALGVAAIMARPVPAGQALWTPLEQDAGLLVGLATVAGIAAVVALPRSPLARALSLRPLLWIGRRSYGLYLYHYTIISLVSPWEPNGHVPWRNGLIALALSFAVAAASYRWVEQPAIRWMKQRERRVREGGTRTQAGSARLALVQGG